jgi:MFS family permease
MAALWATTMMIFAYVDLFSLFRPDFRAALDQGKVFVFDVGQPFLLGVTIYVIIPSLMIYLSLVMPRRLNRVVSISLAGLYAVTIVGGAVGEWSYYVLGSVVEVVLLALVIHHSWTWRAPKTD